MKILVACEESQVVTKAFRNIGHNAYSCDILPCSDGHPEWHFRLDVLNLLNRYSDWDMMIAFPPCTYLTVTANRSYINNPTRWKKRLEAVLFVWKLWNTPIPKIAIENPMGVLSSHIGKPTQYIQPYEFGHPESKKTGLWLKNLPKLKPTNIVEPEWITAPSGKRMSKRHWKNPSTNNSENAKLRAKTYSGIAKAMTNQWG